MQENLKINGKPQIEITLFYYINNQPVILGTILVHSSLTLLV